MTRRGLGRGLSSLIPAAPPGAPPPDALVEDQIASPGLRLLPIDNVSPNPRQPRQAIVPEALAELAASIREHGLIQPIIVTSSSPEDPAPYIIIAGERRWRASRLAGLDEVPVVVKEASPQDMLELALVENIQRADLNPLEEASAYQTLIIEFGLTQEQVADRVGKSRTAVTNIVRLLRLPDAVKEALMAGQIREGHARALLGLNDDQAMIEASKLVINRGLSVRQTEELVRRLNTPTPPKSIDEDDLSNTPESRALENRLREFLGTKVNLFRTRKGGRIVIHFYSEEELADLYDKLIDEPL
jgi:ParB family chromosome partitioning protein